MESKQVLRTKLLLLTSIFLLTTLMLLTGCENQPSAKNLQASSSGSSAQDSAYGSGTGSGTAGSGSHSITKGKYTGFMDWKPGMWAETVTNSGGQKMTTRMEIIESDNDKIVFQYTVKAPGENVERVSQIWMDKSRRKPLKYVMDINGQTVCMDTGEIPEGSTPKDDDTYPPDFPSIKYGTYTTPTGKKVNAAIFGMGGNEAWVSSEVPFGMVKLVAGGQTLSYLKDFGMSGAKSHFTKSQIENCKDLANIANQMATQMQTQPTEDNNNYDSGSYIDSGDAEAQDYNGQAAPMDCSVCDQMPPAARSACLQSCS